MLLRVQCVEAVHVYKATFYKYSVYLYRYLYMWNHIILYYVWK